MWGCSAFSFTGVRLWTDRSCERSRNRKDSQPRWNICHVVSTASDSWRDLVQRLRYAALTSAGVIGVIHCACVPRYRSWRALPRSSLYGGCVIGVVFGSFWGGLSSQTLDHGQYLFKTESALWHLLYSLYRDTQSSPNLLLSLSVRYARRLNPLIWNVLTSIACRLQSYSSRAYCQNTQS